MFSTKTFTFALLAISAVIPSVMGTCNGSGGVLEDCCWGGTDNYKACNRQLQSATACSEYEVDNYCSNNGVTPEECGADCCSISQKIGIGCPK